MSIYIFLFIYLYLALASLSLDSLLILTDIDSPLWNMSSTLILLLCNSKKEKTRLLLMETNSSMRHQKKKKYRSRFKWHDLCLTWRLDSGWCSWVFLFGCWIICSKWFWNEKIRRIKWGRWLVIYCQLQPDSVGGGVGRRWKKEESWFEWIIERNQIFLKNR